MHTAIVIIIAHSFSSLIYRDKIGHAALRYRAERRIW